MIKFQDSYSYDDLIISGEESLFGDGNAQLPAPPMLMFDRITEIKNTGGAYDKGLITAELDVNRGLWFFDCHFKGDPVMPGCLGLDAMWQLVGFYLGWDGAQGKGRALGVGDLKFSGQVTPDVKLVQYVIDVKRVIKRGKLAMGIADGTMLGDGEVFYKAKNLKVGVYVSEEGEG